MNERSPATSGKPEGQQTSAAEAPTEEAVDDQRGAEAAPGEQSGGANGVQAEGGEATCCEVSDTAGLRGKVAELEDRLLRAKADFQNLQRRTAIERSEAIRYANAELMKSLVGVLDDFERSLAAGVEATDVASVLDGERLIHENFRKALVDHGLELIRALHEPFDPSIHEALMQRPSDDHPPGTVLEEVAKGYRLRDRVLRPTRVIVSKADHTPDSDAPPCEGADADADDDAGADGNERKTQ